MKPIDDDVFAAGFVVIIIFVILALFVALSLAKGQDEQKQRIQTYQNQLNTYILCVQKATDKSVCGKQPDIQNYL
jgi:type II secretory pathway pseudopilin PulG